MDLGSFCEHKNFKKSGAALKAPSTDFRTKKLTAISGSGKLSNFFGTENKTIGFNL